ncbi:hypothetical protein BOTBODRAFT_29157 [Botryobasidium botryosum FD-172 SS1]|uniref:Wax synthase domain-containing protein n=1 Tax=Botryobasidium botryosum (strain FD-172 SS1) TaxID=930990 RepID=A0A067MQL8_BOTB1|nr:hypothetical protein BOTBODRAFT_29157 [Botryobasidium botryosum FD-172 SS1]
MLEEFLENPRLPISIPAYVLSQAFLFLALIIPRDVIPLFWSRIIFFPGIALATAYNLHYNTPTTVVIDYIIGCALAATLIYSSGLVLMQDAQEVQLVGQAKPTSEFGILWRTRWALQLMVDVRGVGFSNRAHNIPPLPTETRSQFIISHVFRILRTALLADLAQITIFRDPYALKPNPLVVEPIWRPAFRMLVLGFSGIATLQTMHTVISLVAVGSGLSSPQAWPDWFGPLSHVYTVRNFWGKTWHQALQRIVVPHNKFVAHTLLRLPRGSYLSAFVQLLVAFGLSALLHGGGDYMTARRLDISWKFFVSQAFAIAAEDWVARICGGMVTSPVARRAIGYVWVVMWFTISLPWILESWIDMGLVAPPRESISVLRGLWNGEWTVRFDWA